MLDHWAMFDGYAVAHNMPDLGDLPVDRLCSFVYWYVTREADPKEVEKFRARLWQPIPGDSAPIPQESPWSAENETRAFQALKAGTVGGG